eukprot:CAMPEP_0171183546 /NCGR_PEP_ID=MMETSP0790-20130122/15333_1 /TAXON_ID=2925 /ORGANISM="Alexandrium catenella, Strain OF101" /LENGTH=487 /DNA_ID=CAMNT_0011648523 /DNA_START=100 /DNA_END=1565 /DNA_ORIENTATION=+
MPGDVLSYGGTPMGAGRVVVTSTGMQSAGVLPLAHAYPQGSAYISVQSRQTASSGSYSATPVREPVSAAAYAVAPARETLTTTTASASAPVIVSRLVSQNSLSNLPRYPQVVGTASGQTTYSMPEAYTVSAASGAIVEKTMIQTHTSPMSTMDVNEAMKATPVWSRTLGATSMQFQGDEADRQTIAMQDARIRELTQEVQACNENAARLSDELEKARGEVARLTVELQQEHFAREQAEAALQSPQPIVSQTVTALTPTASASGAKIGGSAAAASNGRTASAPRRAKEAREVIDKDEASAAAVPAATERQMTAAERREAAVAERRAAVAERKAAAEAAAADGRRAAAEAAQSVNAVGRSTSRANGGSARNKESPGTSRPASAKDEIDSRLLDYVSRSECGIVFKRLNRGFYTFRRGDENGPVSADRTIEITIVNGKLMIKMEPSSTHPGWNNGKAGPIERFVTKMMAEEREAAPTPRSTDGTAQVAKD